jgi:hypothetical protein
MAKSIGAHLVGSVPLSNAAEVFEQASRQLAGRVRRIPDGETGPRFMWVGWQQQVFERTPQLERVQAADSWGEAAEDYAEQQGSNQAPPSFRLADGVETRDVAFPPLGYADEAIASFETFRGLQADRVIAPGVRFQVSMPTPVASCTAFLEPGSFAAVEPVYEAAMLAELQRILDAIPHDQLAIQWDVAIEVFLVEGWVSSPFQPALDGVVERLVRLGEAVPDDVELGLHMCFGDLGGHHLREPDDTKALVDITNGVVTRLGRRIDWWHFPVPIARDDEAYFAPLRDLRLSPDTAVYAGLVHLGDGVEGALRRARAASGVIDIAGIATECGLGRRPPEQAIELLRLHDQIGEALEASAIAH